MEKKALRRFIIISLAIATLLSTSVPVFAANDSKCDVDLSLLDSSLLRVLQELADLSIRLRDSAPGNPITVKVSELVREKTEALDRVLTQDAIREAARKYYDDLLLGLAQSNLRHEDSQIEIERQQRLDEEGLITGYVKLVKPGLNLSKQKYALMTPDGILLSAFDKTNVTIHDVLSDETRHLTTLTLQDALIYSAGSDELFGVHPGPFASNTATIESIVVKDVLAAPSADTNNFKKTIVLSVDAKSKERMDAAVRTVWPEERINNSSYFRFFKVSEDGNVLVSTYEVFNRKAKTETGLVAYNRKEDRFTAVKLHQNVGNLKYRNGWSISPDGKIVAWAQTEQILVYSLETGEYLHNIDAIPDGVVFGHTSDKILFNYGPMTFKVADAWDKEAPQRFDVDKHYADPKKRSSVPRNAYFSPDDSRIFATSEDGYLWIWDANTRKLLERTKFPGTTAYFSKDHEILMNMQDIFLGEVGVTLWKRR